MAASRREMAESPRGYVRGVVDRPPASVTPQKVVGFAREVQQEHFARLVSRGIPAVDAAVGAQPAGALAVRRDLRERSRRRSRGVAFGSRIFGQSVDGASPARGAAVGSQSAVVCFAGAESHELARRRGGQASIVVAPALDCAVRADAAGVLPAGGHRREPPARRVVGPRGRIRVEHSMVIVPPDQRLTPATHRAVQPYTAFVCVPRCDRREVAVGSVVGCAAVESGVGADSAASAEGDERPRPTAAEFAPARHCSVGADGAGDTGFQGDEGSLGR